MATVTKGRTFVSGETVTPAKLNDLVDLATVTAIVNADIDANAAIAGSKLASGAITDTQLATGAVTGAAGGGKIAASAITAQTVIADPLADTDEFLVHDASASALRKVAYSNIAPTVTAAKLDGVAKDGSGNNLSAGAAPIFGCRAWVNFDGTSVTNVGGEDRCTIRAAGNVSKVVRNATGDYTVTFTTAMPDANYAVTMLQQRGDGAGINAGQFGLYATASNAYGPITTTSFRIITTNSSGSPAINYPVVCAAIFR